MSGAGTASGTETASGPGTTPSSTYRLQLTAEFTFADATAIVPHLRSLGADWLYLSPVLQATPGSTHGYDVVDHSSIDAERGGEEGLRALAQAAHDAGMGVLVDIVPNHVGVSVPHENAWWWELLRLGRDSPVAEFFDVDWAAGDGKLRVPVLGGTAEEAVANGELVVATGPTGEPELHYFEHRYPLAPGSADDGADAGTVHARQSYELVNWRRADHELNYRRFFAVNELAAIRVEEPEVFEASHALILRLIDEGIIDGLRVDHPDGLADPGAYLATLRSRIGDAPLLVEKILEPGEPLAPFWPVEGTTGYDALGEIDRVLIDPSGEEPLDALEVELGGRPGAAWHDVIRGTKRGIADTILGSEVRRLVRDSGLVAVDGAFVDPALTEEALVDAVAEVLAAMPVYRSYLPHGRDHLDAALASARAARPELGASLDALAPLFHDPASAFGRRTQQTSGMVMAKGVEDTAFYRTSRLGSLTEVGGDPSIFALSPAAFHTAQLDRAGAWPRSMTTLSTHDTKRSEDTRARLNVLSEAPEEWAAFLRRRLAHAELSGQSLGDGVAANLLWQAVVGSWPREREALHAYADKAMREANEHTTWTAPDAEFEARMHALVDSAFDDPETAADVTALVALLGDAGRANGLAAKLLQLTGPGLPDVYQGSELWERSLVDPDNRRPVDHAGIAATLARLDEGWIPPVDESAAAKVLVTSRALRLRRDRPELFTRYRPLAASGPAADHALAIDRGGALVVATRLSLRLARAGGWRDTVLPLPPGEWVDAFTGDRFAGDVDLPALTATYPVALLIGGDR